MAMSRNNYVMEGGGEWKVRLEGGRVISTCRTQKAARREAKRLGRNDDRGVTVNAAAGYTRYSIGKDEL